MIINIYFVARIEYIILSKGEYCNVSGMAIVAVAACLTVRRTPCKASSRRMRRNPPNNMTSTTSPLPSR